MASRAVPRAGPGGEQEDERVRREMEQRSRSFLAGLSFEDGDSATHNWDTMLSKALDQRGSGADAVALFMDSAHGGWNRPVPAPAPAAVGGAAAEGSRRNKKTELDQAPRPKADAEPRAAAGNPKALRGEKSAAKEERLQHSTAAAIDSLRHLDQHRAPMSDAAIRQHGHNATNHTAAHAVVPVSVGSGMASAAAMNCTSTSASISASSAPWTSKPLQHKPHAPRSSDAHHQRSGASSRGDHSGQPNQGSGLQDLDPFEVVGVTSPRIAPLGKGGVPGLKKGVISSTAQRHVGFPNALNCLRLKDGDQSLLAEGVRAGKDSSALPAPEMDFANREYTLAKRAQDQARQRKEKQKARDEIDGRVRSNLVQQAVSACECVCREIIGVYWYSFSNLCLRAC